MFIFSILKVGNMYTIILCRRVFSCTGISPSLSSHRDSNVWFHCRIPFWSDVLALCLSIPVPSSNAAYGLPSHISSGKKFFHHLPSYRQKALMNFNVVFYQKVTDRQELPDQQIQHLFHLSPARAFPFLY